VEGEVTFFYEGLCNGSAFETKTSKFDTNFGTLGKDTDNPQPFKLKVLEAISYFGESDIFLKKERRFDAVASKDSHTLLLARIEFESIIKEEFPHIYRELSQIAIAKYDQELKLTWELKSLVRASCPDLECEDNDEELQSAGAPEDHPYLRLTLHDLYEKSKDRFPVEELLQPASNEKRKSEDIDKNDSDLDFEKVKTGEIEVLARELRGSRAFKTRLPETAKIKARRRQKNQRTASQPFARPFTQGRRLGQICLSKEQAI